LNIRRRIIILFSLSLVLSFSSKRARVAPYPKKKRECVLSLSVSLSLSARAQRNVIIHHCNASRERGRAGEKGREENRNDRVSLLASKKRERIRRRHKRKKQQQTRAFLTHIQLKIHYSNSEDGKKKFFFL